MMMFPSSSLWLSKCSICPSSTLNRSLIRFFINIKCLPFCISLPPFIRQDKGNRKEDTFDFKDGTHSLMNSGHTRTQFISKKRHRHKIFQRADNSINSQPRVFLYHKRTMKKHGSFSVLIVCCQNFSRPALCRMLTPV